MNAPITPEHLVAVAQREGIHLDKASNVLKVVMLLVNALSCLPANQFANAKQVTLVTLLERSPDRIEAMLDILFPQEVCHGLRP